MTLTDWRDLPASAIVPLYERERARWLAALSWDTAPSWDAVETGRAAGRVPGLVARDARGRIEGWAFYILHDGVLQVGGVVASRPMVTRCLVDGILTSVEASLATSLTCFLFPGAPGLGSALARQRFAASESLYLTRPVSSAAPPPPAAPGPEGAVAGVRRWRGDDLANSVRLLASAYQGVPGAACFAPDGRLDQWVRYVAQLVSTPGCGRFSHECSFVVSRELASADALVMTTWLSETTAHLAQVAVARDRQGRGVGRAIVQTAIDAAIERGAREITLMVDIANESALTFYKRLGFRERARFLHASRSARRRVAA